MEKEKIKEIKLPMKFNPGFKKYEPELPVKKSNKKLKVKVDWRFIILVIISIIILTGFVFLVSKFNLFG